MTGTFLWVAVYSETCSDKEIFMRKPSLFEAKRCLLQLLMPQCRQASDVGRTFERLALLRHGVVLEGDLKNIAREGLKSL